MKLTTPRGKTLSEEITRHNGDVVRKTMESRKLSARMLVRLMGGGDNSHLGDLIRHRVKGGMQMGYALKLASHLGLLVDAQGRMFNPSEGGMPAPLLAMPAVAAGPASVDAEIEPWSRLIDFCRRRRRTPQAVIAAAIVFYIDAQDR